MPGDPSGSAEVTSRVPATAEVMAGWPERTAAIRRASARLCMAHGWSALHEVSLPNSRRADLLALTPDGRFVCIEVKSGDRDFLSDGKWPDYREYCDTLYFAVDADFAQALLPDDVGIIVAHDGLAEIIRPGAAHPLTGSRRRALLLRFARLAAVRLMAREDPDGMALARAALLPE